MSCDDIVKAEGYKCLLQWGINDKYEGPPILFMAIELSLNFIMRYY